MQVTINRQLLGLEDLLFGEGTVEQTRGGQLLTITKINAGNLPFDDTRTLAEAMYVIDTEVIPNLATILASPANAQIAADAAADAQNLYNLVASLYDQFDDRYLGSKDIDPTLDNDGNTLLVGALYFNTITNKMRVWDGTTWGDSLVLTTTSISTLTNKTIDSITNKVGANHIHYPVRNVSGSTIAKGVVVTAQGTQSGTDYIEIVPVTNPQTQVALGIMHTTVANNGTGLCINTGVSADMVDTSGWAVGTILYPNASGGLTSTKPTSGRYQACAIVLRSHANQGTLLCEFTEPKYIASTTQAGYVQLNNTLTSTSTTQALTAAQGKELQDGKQPLDATLTALAGVTTSADKYIYATGADTFTTGTITSFGRSLVDDVDAATARGTLGISATNTPFTPAGNIAATNVQAAVQELDSEKAPLASPAFTGTPTAPTAAVGTNTTQVATTEFVQAEIANDTFSKTELTMAIGNINSPLLDMPLKNSLTMKAGVGSATFTRASTAMYIDRYGMLKTAAVDEPRFEKEGYLNEGASTNLVLYSNDFSNAAWIKMRATVTANQTDPYGTTSAVFYNETTDVGTSYVYQNFTLTAGTTYSASIFVKKGTASEVLVWFSSVFTTPSPRVEIRFNFDTKTISFTSRLTSSSFVELANGWFRISFSFLVVNTTTGSGFVISAYPDTNTIGNTVYIFGAQLEALPFATSYIPTTSSTVTRETNFLNVTREGNLPNLEVGGEITVAYDIVSFGDTSSYQWVWGLYSSSTNTIGAYISSDGLLCSACGSATDFQYTPRYLLNKNTIYRVVQVINTTSNSLYVNGVLVASKLGADDRLTDTQNSAYSLLRIGSYDPTSQSQANQFFGNISNFRIWDRSLTAQEVALA